MLIEVVVAPSVDDRAAEVLARKRRMRLLVTGGMPDPKAPGMNIRSIPGGLLVQERDRQLATAEALKVVTKRAPTPAQIADLLFADIVAKHVKSNAIVLAKDGATVGIGAGQPSRVDSVKIAAAKTAEFGLSTQGAVLASDAFFPFADGLEAGIAAGIAAATSPAAHAATTRSSPPPTRPASPWCFPGSGTSGIEALA